MRHKPNRLGGALLLAGLLLSGSAGAFNMGNMMNPSKWMNSNKHDDDDYYDDYRRGGYPPPPPPPGYGGPGYGTPGYGAPGYGAPGYGRPGYGGAPYGAPANQPKRPDGGGEEAEIQRLKERIRRLEQSQQQNRQPPPAPAQPGAPYQGNRYGQQPGYQQQSLPPYGGPQQGNRFRPMDAN
ncbi:MAG TPA: hypothetical protein ENK05_02640 [Gammaproteobacteria bacterium]|nr:hypothetical protein [Gammaproteobacteria bacterium]